MSTPLQRVRLVQDAVLLKRGLYLLAEAIYTTAQAEAQGQLSHWTGVQLEQTDLDAIQADAKLFIEDWRNHFGKRTRIKREGLNHVPTIADYRCSRKRT